MALSSSDAEFNPEEHPHQRFNPLTGEWVLVSPHRCRRPWHGQTESAADRSRAGDCENSESQPPSSGVVNPLRPGAVRANGQVNPEYTSTYVFPNDYPALLEHCPVPPDDSSDPLFKCAPARGVCRVMCFHPDSQLTIPLMTQAQVTTIVDRWAELVDELSSGYSWLQIFENRGVMMGCSNQHPHCQLWASQFMPARPQLMHDRQLHYWELYARPLLLDYLQRELQYQTRIVCLNESFVALVPYWALWPYELLLLPRRHVLRLNQLTAAERQLLAAILQQLLTKYDNLFGCDFPYSMGWYGAPTGVEMQLDQSHWQLHAVYLPPLLRSSNVKKFMVGYELLAQPQRDITAEKAAENLRQCSDVHYLRRQAVDVE